MTEEGPDPDGGVPPGLLAALERQRHAARLAGPLAESPEDVPDVTVRIVGYAIDGKIDSGGQASVYRATQLSTGRAVAIKVLAGGPFLTAASRARFDREAAVLARLTHPAIVGILERGRTADGSYFFVMDYLAGVDLQTHLDGLAASRAPLSTVVDLFGRICEALEEAHRNG